MQVIKTLTLSQFEDRLRKLGIKLQRSKTKALIEQGVFEGVVYHIGGKQDEYFILEKDFKRWVERYADEEVPTADVMQFALQVTGGDTP